MRMRLDVTAHHPDSTIDSLCPSEACFVDPGKVHLAANDTTAPVRFLATLVVEKDKPPTSPAP